MTALQRQAADARRSRCRWVFGTFEAIGRGAPDACHGPVSVTASASHCSMETWKHGSSHLTPTDLPLTSHFTPTSLPPHCHSSPLLVSTGNESGNALKISIAVSGPALQKQSDHRKASNCFRTTDGPSLRMALVLLWSGNSLDTQVRPVQKQEYPGTALAVLEAALQPFFVQPQNTMESSSQALVGPHGLFAFRRALSKAVRSRTAGRPLAALRDATSSTHYCTISEIGEYPTYGTSAKEKVSNPVFGLGQMSNNTRRQFQTPLPRLSFSDLFYWMMSCETTRST